LYVYNDAACLDLDVAYGEGATKLATWDLNVSSPPGMVTVTEGFHTRRENIFKGPTKHAFMLDRGHHHISFHVEIVDHKVTALQLVHTLHPTEWKELMQCEFALPNVRSECKHGKIPRGSSEAGAINKLTYDSTAWRRDKNSDSGLWICESTNDPRVYPHPEFNKIESTFAEVLHRLNLGTEDILPIRDLFYWLLLEMHATSRLLKIFGNTFGDLQLRLHGKDPVGIVKSKHAQSPAHSAVTPVTPTMSALHSDPSLKSIGGEAPSMRDRKRSREDVVGR
jgi:hypothetical protein